jgi:CheY-like chemotaxis protein
MSKRILIIDDNPVIREVLCEMLGDAEYDVLDAPSGDAGIALQRENLADLVLCDMCMPHKSGIQTIEEIRGAFPEIPIIAISGGPGSEAQVGFTVFEKMLDAALRVGADLTMVKPIRSAELLDTVERLLAD